MEVSLYLVVTTGLLLFALAVSIPVLIDIAREGIERHRKWRRGEMERYTEDEALEGDSEADATGARTCPHCGAENGLEFQFCQQCARPL